MAEMNMNKMMMSLIMICLFSLVFISFMYESARENGGVSIADDPRLNESFNSLSDSLNSFYTNASSMSTSFKQDKADVSFGSLIFSSIGNLARSMPDLIFNSFNAVYDFIHYGLISQSTVLLIIAGVLFGGLLILVILVIWRLLKIGI